jgi:hypothetical protein
MEELFQNYSQILESECNVRENIKKIIKEAEKYARLLNAQLQSVHGNIENSNIRLNIQVTLFQAPQYAKKREKPFLISHISWNYFKKN